MKSNAAIKLGIVAGAMLLSTAAQAITKAECVKAGGSWVTVYIGGVAHEGCSLPMLHNATGHDHYAQPAQRNPVGPLPSKHEPHKSPQ
jgi:hypothetical protein